jgi:proteasome lid subunit RPN8/RPN11
MLGHARSGYPHEVCGILLAVAGRPNGVLRVVDSLPVENRETEQPSVRYTIAPEDLLRVQRDSRARALEVAGYYHSHPDHPARPSETDRRIAAEGLSDGVIHVVVGVQGGVEATPTAWVFRDAAQAFEPEPFEVE